MSIDQQSSSEHAAKPQSKAAATPDSRDAQSLRQTIGHFLLDKLPWLVLSLAILSAHWAAVSIEKAIHVWVEHGLGAPDWLGVAFVAFFILMVSSVYRMRRTWYRPRTRYLVGDRTPVRPNLIIFLSELVNPPTDWKSGIPNWFIPSWELDKDLLALAAEKKSQPKNKWQWEMPLRALAYHSEALREIVVICSPESLQQCSWFSDIVLRYKSSLPFFKRTRVLIVRKGKFSLISPATILVGPNTPDQAVDFERFDELSSSLFYVFKKLIKEGAEEDSLVVDFTGGQKVTSVVAAVVTINREIKAQYVSTKTDDVRGYDLEMGLSETGGLEWES